MLEKTVTASEVFQEEAIKNALKDALISNVQDQATLYGAELPTSLTSVSKRSVSIDSLIVVEILCSVEPLIGCSLPQKLVKEGGYESVNQALDHLMPSIKEVWQKNQKVKAKAKS